MVNWIGFVVGFLLLGGGIAQMFRGVTHDDGGIWRSYWRKKNASDKQVGLGRRYGLSLTTEMTSGEAGELLTQAIGSARIDPYLRPDWRR